MTSSGEFKLTVTRRRRLVDPALLSGAQDGTPNTYDRFQSEGLKPSWIPPDDDGAGGTPGWRR